MRPKTLQDICSVQVQDKGAMIRQVDFPVTGFHTQFQETQLIVIFRR